MRYTVGRSCEWLKSSHVKRGRGGYIKTIVTSSLPQPWSLFTFVYIPGTNNCTRKESSHGRGCLQFLRQKVHVFAPKSPWAIEFLKCEELPVNE